MSYADQLDRCFSIYQGNSSKQGDGSGLLAEGVLAELPKLSSSWTAIVR